MLKRVMPVEDNRRDHLLADSPGFPLQVILTGGERHDISQAESLLAPFHCTALARTKCQRALKADL